MNKLEGRVVLITGAGRGSGRLLAQALAERGAIMALNDISPVNVEKVVEEITTKGGRARAYVDDIAMKYGAQQIINQVEDDFGGVDILINHAAVEPYIALLEMDEWDWHRVLDVNLTGAFLMTQMAGRLMRAQGWGVIVNLISTSARGPGPATAFLASMQGLAEFTRQAARELKPYGIEVYTLTSGPEILDDVFRLLQMEAR